MACHESVRRAREPPVGHQRHGIAETLADEGGGDGQHLRHPGLPAGPSYRMTTTSPARIDPWSTASSAAFSLSNTRAGTAMMLPVVAGHLDDGAFGREVAAKDDETARLLQRIRQRTHDLLARCFCGLRGFFANRPARDRDRVLAQRARLRPAAARRARMPPAAWRSMATKRPPGLRSASSGVFRLTRSNSPMSSRMPDFPRDGRQVQHGVGGSAAC